MFRRILFPSCGGFSSILLNEKRLLMTEDPVEREREKELREKVLQRYRGMKIPELTDFRYGNFAAQEGTTTAAASQAYSAINNNGFSIGGSDQNVRPGVDWLMLFTGIALVYASSKIVVQRLSGSNMDDVNVPIWTGSIESQAKYLLFLIQYDLKFREQIRQTYHSVRQANPFTDFFQWLKVYYPEYGQGNVYNYDIAINTLINILSSGDSQSLMALARGVQKALRNQNGNPGQRVDDFINDLGSVGVLGKTKGNNLVPGYNNSPIITPSFSPASSSLPLNPQSTQVYGSEPVSIQNALDAIPNERHSSVPFQ